MGQLQCDDVLFGCPWAICTIQAYLLNGQFLTIVINFSAFDRTICIFVETRCVTSHDFINIVSSKSPQNAWKSIENSSHSCVNKLKKKGTLHVAKCWLYYTCEILLKMMMLLAQCWWPQFLFELWHGFIYIVTSSTNMCIAWSVS